MSDTPISDSTPHNVGDLGIMCRRFERELIAAYQIIRQQQLLDEENLMLNNKIEMLTNEMKRLEIAAWKNYNTFHKAKEAKL